MKSKSNHLFIALAGLALTTLNAQFSSALAQGSLTPPGAPAPTMKSLDQVEARTIVNAANTPGDSLDSFIISQPGSYYLTTNLTGVSGKNGIEITTNNVTLDLNGFAVQGFSDNASGIIIPNASVNITLRNGTISGWLDEGVINTSPSAINVVCERLDVSTCGSDGIYLNGSGVVRDCNCGTNLSTGIACEGGVLISGCTANNNFFGFNLGNNCTVTDCTANGNVFGFFANGSYCVVKDCTATRNNSDGIEVYDNYSIIVGNNSSGNGGYGIYVGGSENRIDNNSLVNNTSFGIYPNNINVTNSITRNSSPGAGYGNTAGNNDYAPIGTPNTATSPWANFH